LFRKRDYSPRKLSVLSLDISSLFLLASTIASLVPYNNQHKFVTDSLLLPMAIRCLVCVIHPVSVTNGKALAPFWEQAVLVAMIPEKANFKKEM